MIPLKLQEPTFKLHPSIHCHIYALIDETRQDKLCITMMVHIFVCL